MGAWGVDIFENDDALDIRDRFDRLMRQGLSMKEVTRKCVDGFPDPMNDVSVVLALAELQMEHRELQPEIKQRALEMIHNKQDVHLWVEPDKRMQVLEDFKAQLTRY